MQMHVAPLAGGAAVTTTATEVEAVDAAPAAGAEPAAGAYGMPPADFERLLAAIRDEDFADGKRRVVEDSAESWTFTCKQVASILELFTFGDDKLAALRVLAPRLVDPENAYTIYRVFEFDSDKDEARSILRSAR
ncbi:MAG: DUF4476 domain-containing protein [Deltaproteobacteria bacterium]|nr:MAG: DUF4476 domain-containing protein [Deltaproteobacteria bacterium]